MLANKIKQEGLTGIPPDMMESLDEVKDEKRDDRMQIDGEAGGKEMVLVMR